MLQRFAPRLARSMDQCAIPLAMLGLALAAALFAWRWGPAEQGYFDSAFYLDGARHLARGDGYVSAYVELGHSEFDPITHWAPGIALLMAPLIALGSSPLTAAAIVLGSCYVAAVVLVFALGIELAGRSSWPLGLLVSLVCAAMPATLLWLDALLSDLPWLTFALLNVWFAARVMRAPEAGLLLRVSWGVCIAWLILVRYAGMLLVPGLMLGTLFFELFTRRPRFRRALQLWPTALVAVFGAAAWNLRNQHVAGKPLGGWTFADSEPAQHAEAAARAAFSWIDDLLRLARELGLELALRLLLSAAALSLIPLLLLSMRAARRELCLVGLSALGYFTLMVGAASVTVLASMSETRFWIVLWPLELLLVLIVVARARPRWTWLFKGVVVSALLCALALFALRVQRELPGARRALGLLSPAWARAAAVLPAEGTCQLFVNDPRPFMLHRALGPTRAIPATLEEFDSAVKDKRPTCVVVSATGRPLRLSTSAERRRGPQTAVVERLLEQQRLERIDRRDGITVYRLRQQAL